MASESDDARAVAGIRKLLADGTCATTQDVMTHVREGRDRTHRQYDYAVGQSERAEIWGAYQDFCGMCRISPRRIQRILLLLQGGGQ